MKTLAILSAFLLAPSVGHAVQWEQQAQRLQLVSAALLDDASVPSPRPENTFSLEINTSFLPEVSAHVGGKTESVPSSPVHAVPAVKYGVSGRIVDGLRLAFEASAGFLPGQASNLVGLSATATQNTFRTAVGLAADYDDDTEFYTTAGFEWTNAAVRGGITARGARDAFDVRTGEAFLTETVNRGPWYVGCLVGSRFADTHFSVAADKTNFNLSDTRVMLEATAGYAADWGGRIAASVYFVPQRLIMPRLTLAYDFPLKGMLARPGAQPEAAKSNWQTEPVDIYGRPLEKAPESTDANPVYYCPGTGECDVEVN